MLTIGGLAAVASPTTGSLALASKARRRLSLRLVLVFAFILLAAEVAYLSPFSDPVASQPVHVPSPVAFAEVQPYGVNTFLHKEVDRWKKDKTLEMAQEMGVGWVKQQFPWAEIEYRADPDRPYWDVKNNQNAWEKFDGIVSMAEEHGLRIIARIDSAPGWSHPANADPKAPPSDDHLADFGNFIEEFVARYRGRVAAIQVWNEPNLRGEWVTGRPVNPAEYVQLLKTAYDSAKSVDPNVIVLAAPLATNNETVGYNGNMNEFDYLQQMYDAGARGYFDAMSANAYGKDFPPEDPPSKEKLNFRRVELLHDVLVKNGDVAKAVWFNEYGWNASPPDMQPKQLFWGRVTAEQQAEYTVRGIEYARQHWPWAGVFTIWYLRQVGDIPTTASEYYFGLVNPDFVRGPTYRAVQEAASRSETAAGPGTWGLLSSPFRPGPGWRTYMQPQAAGAIAVAPSSAGQSLDIPFEGTGIQLTLVPVTATFPLTDTDLVPARYYVTLDGGTRSLSPDLPRDAKGNVYLPLPEGREPLNIPIAAGLGDQLRVGRHLLQIQAQASSLDSGQQSSGAPLLAPQAERFDLPGIGAVTVEARRSYTLFSILTLLLLALMGTSVWLLRRRSLPVEAERAGR